MTCRLVVGVDGGNSKTIAVVARADGTIVGAGRAGCSDMYATVKLDIALDEVETAVRRALGAAGGGGGAVDAGAFSMAGADWPEDMQEVATGLRDRELAERVMVVNDAMGALRAGSAEGTGVVVVCGTGAAIGAKSPDGTSWHSSWWQEPQGSRDLTRKALRAVYRAELGIDAPTSLRGRALNIYQRDSVEALLHLFISRGESAPDRVPEMTRALLEEAEAGDPAARAIVKGHGSSLGDYALAAARRVGIEGSRYPLFLSGGVFRHESGLLSDALIERVRTFSPLADPRAARFEPAIGALLLALELAGAVVDEDLLRRIEESMPEPSLFDTQARP